MHLEERLLKNVLGHLGVTQVMPQIAEQLLFVAADQFLEHPAVPLGAIAQQEPLVAPRDQGLGPQARTRSCSIVPFILIRIQ